MKCDDDHRSPPFKNHFKHWQAQAVKASLRRVSALEAFDPV